MFELDTPRTTMTGVSPALTESARTEMGQYRKSSTLRAKSSVTSRPDGLWHMDQWWCKLYSFLKNAPFHHLHA